MAEILATYLVRITVREPDEPGELEVKVPTNAAIEEVVQSAVAGAIRADGGYGVAVTASSERTDV